VLLERLPKWELKSYENQTILDRLRDRISTAKNLKSELELLYKVNNFSEFALGLMWIAEKVEKDPTLEESSIAEESFIFKKFKQAVGEIAEEGESTLAGGFPSDSLALDEKVQTPDVLLEPAWNPSEKLTPSPVANVGVGKDQERHFAGLLDKFIEAVQAGSDDSTQLMANLQKECEIVILSENISEEYKSFCSMLNDFLSYIKENQYLDDVRVINILSNIQDPFSQWVFSDREDRASLLEPAVTILRDFRFMFE